MFTSFLKPYACSSTVERRSPKPCGGGSSPFRHAINKDKKRRVNIFFLSIALVFVGILVHYTATINTSWSMPVGLYVKTFSVPKKGSIVLVCGPKWLVKWKYAVPAYGCPGGPDMLKTVVGIPGDTVVTQPSGVWVFGHSGGSFYPARYVSKDHEGRTLPRAKKVLHLKHSIYLLSLFNPMSVDSRYIGSVSLDRVRGTYFCAVCFTKIPKGQ